MLLPTSRRTRRRSSSASPSLPFRERVYVSSPISRAMEDLLELLGGLQCHFGSVINASPVGDGGRDLLGSTFGVPLGSLHRDACSVRLDCVGSAAVAACAAIRLLPRTLA